MSHQDYFLTVSDSLHEVDAKAPEVVLAPIGIQGSIVQDLERGVQDGRLAAVWFAFVEYPDGRANLF